MRTIDVIGMGAAGTKFVIFNLLSDIPVFLTGKLGRIKRQIAFTILAMTNGAHCVSTLSCLGITSNYCLSLGKSFLSGEPGVIIFTFFNNYSTAHNEVTKTTKLFAENVVSTCNGRL